MKTLTIGISSCPNDTFAFHALMSGAIRIPGYQLDFHVADVEELNELLLEGSLDITKSSFHAALLATESYGIAPCGAALGFGVGPLLVSRHNEDPPKNEEIILCPGKHTTATLLTKLFFPDTKLKQLVFSDVAPALQNKEATFGVLIHEGRFTYQDLNLFRVADLGELWHAKTSLPIPLGGIVAKKSLGAELVRTFSAALRESINYGYSHKEDALITMQHYAQELSPEHLWPHVELYVNEQTLQLSKEAEAALMALHSMAKSLELIPANATDFTIFS
jgi:1,4-dihydroxy-6-naphthoate synthase